MTKTPNKPAAGLPDEATLLAFLRDAGSAEKGDIARHFGLKGEDRRALREMIRGLEAEGKLGKRGRKGFTEAGALPPVGVADVVEKDADGDLYRPPGRGLGRRARAPPDPRPTRPGPAPGLGDRILAKFEHGPNGWEARLIKKLDTDNNRVLGVIRKSNRETRVEPVDRRSKDVLIVPPVQADRPARRRPGARRHREVATSATAPSAARSWRSSAARTIPAPPP